MIVLALQENDFKVDDGEFFAFTQKPLSDLKEPRILAVYRTMGSSLGILYIIVYILLWLLLEKPSFSLDVATTVVRGLDMMIRFIYFPDETPDDADTSAADAMMDLCVENGVIHTLQTLLNKYEGNVKCLTPVVNLLSLLADRGDDEAVLVCEAVQSNLKPLLILRKESKYLYNLTLLLLCRLTSLDEGILLLLEDKSAENASHIMSAVVGSLEVVLIAGGDGKDVDSYDRHSFGLSITLLLGMTNTSVVLHILCS